MEVQSALKSYWENEASISALARAYGCCVEEIVDNPSSVSSETVSNLRRLLLNKKHLLRALRTLEMKALVTSSVVNLSKYRSLVGE